MNIRKARISALFVLAAILFGWTMTSHRVSAASDYIAPTVPTSVYAYLTQSSQIYVSWAGSTDDTGVSGYYLYRNGGLIANIPGYTFYTDTPGPGTYYYSVSAYDASGNVSAQSAVSSYITVLPDSAAPSIPTNVTVALASSSATINWDPSTDNNSVAGYYVYRNGYKITTQDPITGTSYVDNGLALGYTYSYRIAAYDASGNISAQSAPVSVTVVFDVTPPSAPSNFSAKAVSQNEVDLSWKAAADNIAATGYYVYRDDNQIGTTASTTFADTSLSPQTQYVYYVIAYDAAGNQSAKSFALGVTTPVADLTPPSTPTGFKAVPVSSSEVDLSWNPSTDANGVAGYYIYRDGVQIGVTASTTYPDVYLSTSTTYLYAVKAYDYSQNLSPQVSGAATTLATSPAVPAPAPAPSPAPEPPTPGPAPEPTPIVNGSLPPYVFASLLSYGSAGTGVMDLQLFLIAHGYLASGYSTGFFGSLTQKAVQAFQCYQNIVCTGSSATTGWGSVGPKTRKVLNSLYGSGS